MSQLFGETVDDSNIFEWKLLNMKSEFVYGDDDVSQNLKNLCNIRF